MRVLLSEASHVSVEREVRIDVEVERIEHRGETMLMIGTRSYTPEAFLVNRIAERYVVTYDGGKVLSRTYSVTIAGPVLTKSGLTHRVHRASDSWSDREAHRNPIEQIPDYIAGLLVGKNVLMRKVANP